MAGALAGNANAQKPATQDYLIQFSGNVAEGEKVVHAAILQQDVDAYVSVSIQLLQAKAVMHVQLDHEQLESVLAPYGIHLVSVMVTSPVDPADRSLHDAKILFLEAHPEARRDRDALREQATPAVDE